MIVFCFFLFSLGSPDMKTFLDILNHNQNLPCPACEERLPEKHKNPCLTVFISFGVPIETWKDFSDQLEKTGGIFVVRGIPEHSFGQLAVALAELGNAGVKAPIDIDPEAFERYGIDQVPAIVLQDGKKEDKIVGNVRLDAALRRMAENGEVWQKAKMLLDALEDRS